MPNFEGNKNRKSNEIRNLVHNPFFNVHLVETWTTFSEQTSHHSFVFYLREIVFQETNFIEKWCFFWNRPSFDLNFEFRGFPVES